MADSDPKVALLAGASGLVGSYVLEGLLDAPDFSRVYAITRRPLGRDNARLANRIVQFDKLESQLQGLTCHVAFCCLGSTRREAGSNEEFYKVDVEYVLAFARVARAAGAQRFIVVSSVGADPRSRVFYLRTKGEMEQALAGLGFASVDIMQPGPLYGWRRQIRPLELVAAVIMPLVHPLLMGSQAAKRGISARHVAAAMIGAARSGRKGLYRYTYPAMRALGEVKPVRSVT
jgi:uncharacterized protein YbjT (DUF2867 family)